MRDQDRFRGCLIGGAAGDALGYAVEFRQENQIFSRYGDRGITEYERSGMQYKKPAKKTGKIEMDSYCRRSGNRSR